MNARRNHLIVGAVLLFACRAEPDSFIVIHSDVNCDVPRVFQLRVTVTNDGVADQKTIPENPGPELGFPSTVTLVTSGSRAGGLDIVVEALDASRKIVGRGTASMTLDPKKRVDGYVLITSNLTQPSSIAIAPANPPKPSVDASFDGGVTLSGPEVQAGSGMAFASVSAGAQATCALRQDASLWCWGSNKYGQLRSTSPEIRLTPKEAGLGSWKKVSSAQTHACGIRQDGTLSCWGHNGSGQLGTTGIQTSFQINDNIEDAWQSVSAGSYHTCGVRTDGTLWCWGDNSSGQLGNGTSTSSITPVQIAGAGFAQVSVRFLHGCAVKTDGTLWCWGLNGTLQASADTNSLVLAPRQVVGSDWASVATGYYHTCALKQDANLWCWGGNESGELGTNTIAVDPQAKTGTPTQVSGSWLAFSTGQSHTCGIKTDQSLWCWGDNRLGQLGNGSPISQAAPVQVAGGQTFAEVSAAQTHTCALSTDGGLWCWGDNTNGQLGTGSYTSTQAPAQVVR